MHRKVFNILLLLIGLQVQSMASSPVANDIVQLQGQCNDFNQVQTLQQMLSFHENFKALNSCLQSTPSDTCKTAEVVCEDNGFVYSTVHSVASLIERYKSGEPVCTMEFSSRIYNLSKQLDKTESESGAKLSRILRALANRVATGCRRSLSDRILDVERRAPDTLKFNALILSLLNISADRVGKIKSLIPEIYSPILEDERQSQAIDETIGRSPSGFEFKLSQAARMGLDGVKLSCRALKIYHNNLLGSLGLLASVGYAASPDVVEALNGERADVVARARRWLLTAVLCQSISSVLKLTKVDTEGKLVQRVKILPVQEADLDLSAQFDQQFSTFGLPELKVDEQELNQVKQADSSVFDASLINRRKMQLLNGPNYKLASAIYSYLDLSRPDRLQILYDLLVLKKPTEANEDDDDEEEEDE